MSGAKTKILRVTFLLAALPLLSACAVPLSVTALSFAAGGLSYATTGKSMTDNFLSHFTEADCAMHRLVVDNTPVCIIEPDTALAEADPGIETAQPIYPAAGVTPGSSPVENPVNTASAAVSQ